MFGRLRPTVPCLRRGHSGWNEAWFLARVVHLEVGQFLSFYVFLNLDVPGFLVMNLCMFKVWFSFIPRGSIFGIFAYTWLIFMIDVGIPVYHIL